MKKKNFKELKTKDNTYIINASDVAEEIMVILKDFEKSQDENKIFISYDKDYILEKLNSLVPYIDENFLTVSDITEKLADELEEKSSLSNYVVDRTEDMKLPIADEKELDKLDDIGYNPVQYMKLESKEPKPTFVDLTNVDMSPYYEPTEQDLIIRKEIEEETKELKRLQKIHEEKAELFKKQFEEYMSKTDDEKVKPVVYRMKNDFKVLDNIEVENEIENLSVLVNNKK